jgi:hypothetical protein
VFTADDRTLRRAAFEGDGVITQLWVIDANLKDEHLSQEDRLNFKGEYLKKLLAFQAIGERLNGTSSTNAPTNAVERDLGVLPPVYAQSTVPDWVQKLPSDNISLYFVGKGYDISFTNAKQKSLEDALHNAVSALKQQAPKAPDAAILALVKASAVTQDSAFTFDQRTRNYTYYTLLRLSREIQSIGVRSLPAAATPSLPQIKFQKKGWQLSDLTLNPASGMFALDNTGEVSKLVADQQGSPRIEKLFRLGAGYIGMALTASAESVFVA